MRKIQNYILEKETGLNVAIKREEE